MDAGKYIPHSPDWSRPWRRFRRPFLTGKQKMHLLDEIEEQESRTTGQITLTVIARAGTPDLLAVARQKFVEEGLDATPGRNGVLILVADLDHRFAIWGDTAFYARAEKAFWLRCRQMLTVHFAARRYWEGLSDGVREIGKELARHFPA